MEELQRQEYAPNFVTFLPFNDLYNSSKEVNEFITGCSRVRNLLIEVVD